MTKLIRLICWALVLVPPAQADSQLQAAVASLEPNAPLNQVAEAARALRVLGLPAGRLGARLRQASTDVRAKSWSFEFNGGRVPSTAAHMAPDRAYPPAVYETAEALLALAQRGLRSRWAVALARMQMADGGFASNGERSDVIATALAVRALAAHADRIPVAPAVAHGVAWLRRHDLKPYPVLYLALRADALRAAGQLTEADRRALRAAAPRGIWHCQLGTAAAIRALAPQRPDRKQRARSVGKVVRDAGRSVAERMARFTSSARTRLASLASRISTAFVGSTPALAALSVERAACEGVWIGTLAGRVLTPVGDAPRVGTVSVCADICVDGEVDDEGRFALPVGRCFPSERPVFVYNGQDAYPDLHYDFLGAEGTGVFAGELPQLTVPAVTSLPLADGVLTGAPLEEDLFIGLLDPADYPPVAGHEGLSAFYAVHPTGLAVQDARLSLPNDGGLRPGTQVEFVALGNLEGGLPGRLTTVGFGRIGDDGARVELATSLQVWSWIGYRPIHTHE